MTGQGRAGAPLSQPVLDAMRAGLLRLGCGGMADLLGRGKVTPAECVSHIRRERNPDDYEATARLREQAGPGTVGEAEAERLRAVAAEARAFLAQHGGDRS
jgi:hypothetical protein